ncbi:MAG TPA: hypothetical protein VGC18_11130 [Lacisediminihabitans sp.]|uniref:FitA-like ribbon-helix-helix domain-containing protein n=1 Tax=Lacisediminihabitans sp. TaxID=2787631 RepID=UPI002EDB7A44
MPAIIVRNLTDEVQRGLKRRAAAHNRSMEAEVRAILSAAVGGDGFSSAWVDGVAAFRGDPLPVPPRSAPRDAESL